MLQDLWVFSCLRTVSVPRADITVFYIDLPWLPIVSFSIAVSRKQ